MRERSGSELRRLLRPAASSPVAMSAHERVGLFGCVSLLDRILDARPEFFLDPVARHQHFDARQAKVASLQAGHRASGLQRANRVETEVRKEPRAPDEDLSLPTALVWHRATISLVANGITRSDHANRQSCN